MALPDLVKLNYKLIGELTYLKINNMPIRRESITQTESYIKKRIWEINFGGAWPKTTQEGWLETSFLVTSPPRWRMRIPLKLWIINEFFLFCFHPYSAAFGLWLDLSYVCLLQRIYWSYQYEYSDSSIRLMTIIQHIQGWCPKRIRFWAGRVENKVLDYGSVTKVNATFLGYLQFASGPNAAFHCSPSF